MLLLPVFFAFIYRIGTSTFLELLGFHVFIFIVILLILGYGFTNRLVT